MGNFAEELIKGKKFVRKGQHWWGVGNPKKTLEKFMSELNELVDQAIIIHILAGGPKTQKEIGNELELLKELIVMSGLDLITIKGNNIAVSGNINKSLRELKKLIKAVEEENRRRLK